MPLTCCLTVVSEDGVVNFLLEGLPSNEKAGQHQRNTRDLSGHPVGGTLRDCSGARKRKGVNPKNNSCLKKFRAGSLELTGGSELGVSDSSVQPGTEPNQSQSSSCCSLQKAKERDN